MGQCSEPDYEQFSVPTSPDDKNPNCILGEARVYLISCQWMGSGVVGILSRFLIVSPSLGKVMRIKRRVAGKTCFNGPDFKRGLPQNTTCQCSLNDVECDYGYIRSGGPAG